MRLALEIPIDWTEQRKLLGFCHTLDTFLPNSRSRETIIHQQGRLVKNPNELVSNRVW